MEKDLRRSIEDYLRQRADQPFGDVEAVSGQTLQPFSIASRQGAENLLAKAETALDGGDVARATRFVDRAVNMPFDEHEEVAPAAFAAHMMLFNVVTDALEVAVDEDSGWLDAAIDVLGVADEPARFEMRDVLGAINSDYELTSSERSRIRTAVAPIAVRAELRDLGLAPSELRDHILSILHACLRYRAAFEETAGLR